MRKSILLCLFVTLLAGCSYSDNDPISQQNNNVVVNAGGAVKNTSTDVVDRVALDQGNSLNRYIEIVRNKTTPYFSRLASNSGVTLGEWSAYCSPNKDGVVVLRKTDGPFGITYYVWLVGENDTIYTVNGFSKEAKISELQADPIVNLMIWEEYPKLKTELTSANCVFSTPKSKNKNMYRSLVHIPPSSSRYKITTMMDALVMRENELYFIDMSIANTDAFEVRVIPTIKDSTTKEKLLEDIKAQGEPEMVDGTVWDPTYIVHEIPTTTIANVQFDGYWLWDKYTKWFVNITLVGETDKLLWTIEIDISANEILNSKNWKKVLNEATGAIKYILENQ